LGNRSILADARPEANKERINAIVKKREGFRPFAPSVLEEAATEYFELPSSRTDFSHMIFVFKVREKYGKHLGAITHVDGTARVQTVSRTDNPRYWELINEFNKITGTPVILNTSFNNNSEPIVDSVYDAVVCFLTTDLDFLVIDDFLVEKKGALPERLAELYVAIPPYSKIRELDDMPGRYEMGNSFNDKKMDLSPLMFGMLSNIDGNLSIAGHFEDYSVNDPVERAALLKEFLILWEKRMLSLGPIPRVNSNILV
jgi:carbamoyltransferase